MKSCSVNIIVRDAENTIKQCLDSVVNAGCFTEIVIAVDTRSKDRTAQIISSYNSPIRIRAFWYDHKGKFDELGARNAALNESMGNYIFWIDADEVLDRLPNGFCNLLNAERKAFYLHQISLLPDGYYVDYPQVRLFPKIKGVYWELPIHSQVFFLLERIGIAIDDTPYRILHTGYDSREKITERHIRNYPMLLGYLQEHTTNDRKRQYMIDRFKESHSYLASNGLLNMGFLDPVTIGTILSIATSLIITGLQYRESIAVAKKQAGIVRSLEQQEMAQIATALNIKFPTVSVNDWMLVLQLEESMAPSQVTPQPSNGGTQNVSKNGEGTQQNYMAFAILGVILFAVMMK